MAPKTCFRRSKLQVFKVSFAHGFYQFQLLLLGLSFFVLKISPKAFGLGPNGSKCSQPLAKEAPKSRPKTKNKQAKKLGLAKVKKNLTKRCFTQIFGAKRFPQNCHLHQSNLSMSLRCYQGGKDLKNLRELAQE